MNDMIRELRQIVRKLIRTPAFTVVALLTLAIGIGANTAIYSVIDGVLLRPLPYEDSDELVGLWHHAPGILPGELEQSFTTYTLYRENARTLAEIGLVDRTSRNLTGAGDPVRLAAAEATASLFRVLRTPPELGRVFAEDEDDPGAPDVAILSHRIWVDRFGADEGILGRTVSLDGRPFEVIGVMPASFGYPNEETDVWTPLVIRPEDLGLANFSSYAIGRLAPGASVEAAQAELEQILPRMPDEYPGEITAAMMESIDFAPYVRSMKEDVVGDVGRVLWILLGTVGFVLLIAVANVANLFLVRADGRQREMAVRTAMGATRRQVVRTYLAESTVLAVAAGTAGVGLAMLGVRLLLALGPESLPRIGEIGVSGGVLLFTAAVSIVAGLMFGAVPLLKYGRPDLTVSLKEGGRGGSMGKETHRANNALVVAQIALALMLLIGSGLMARSFLELRRVDPGIDPEGVVTLNVGLIPGELDGPGQAAFFQRLLDDVRALPGVEAAGGITGLPLTGGWSNNAMVLEDRPPAEGEVPPIVRMNLIAPGYMETMGIPLLEGRLIERQDHERRTGSVVVSRALAEEYWPGESPIGKRLSPGLPNSSPDFAWYTIVGVVGDVRDDGLDQPVVPMIYYPMVGPAESGGGTPGSSRLSLVVRTSVPPLSIVPAVRNAVWAIDARLPVSSVRTADELVRSSAARTSFTMVMLAIAAFVALLLGTVGVYGVISYLVSRRTREFGIRMAMGAEQGQIRKMVVGQGLRVAAIGVGIGLAGGLALTRLMQALLYGVSATDPVTFGAVALVLLSVSMLAAYLPARRASSVDPSIALRHE